MIIQYKTPRPYLVHIEFYGLRQTGCNGDCGPFWGNEMYWVAPLNLWHWGSASAGDMRRWGRAFA